ncbi:MAG: hypothetical protein AAGI66_07345 [Cyanobacteria bacterium P01_H01_bin.74]
MSHRASNTNHTIYFDRNIGQLYGVLTLQRVNAGIPHKVFKRLPVTSGQLGYLGGGDEDWIRNKGATPFGNLYIKTKPEPLYMEPYGTPFFIITNKPGTRIIEGPDGKRRENIGLHLENKIPGTLGCTALLNNTVERECDAYALFAYLECLFRNNIYYIPYRVL